MAKEVMNSAKYVRLFSFVNTLSMSEFHCYLYQTFQQRPYFVTFWEIQIFSFSLGRKMSVVVEAIQQVQIQFWRSVRKIQ